jgi:hypothetical protein
MLLGLSATESEAMRQRIWDAAASPDKTHLTEAFRLLEKEGQALPAQDRIDLLCLAMATAQSKLHDERFVNRLIVDLMGTKVFHSLDPSQQDTVVAAVLDGERLPLRKGVDEDERFVQDRTVALLRWLTAMAATADPHFDESKRPARQASPPAGYPSGVSPEAIPDPDERKRYQDAIARNDAAIHVFMHQARLRTEVKRATETVRSHVEALAWTKERKARIRDACTRVAKVSPEVVAAVFDPAVVK